jgi:uncharacterized membrane protein YjjB (DUF3815 family)
MTPLTALDWLREAGIGFVATLGFAVWFALPRETLLRAGVVGMGGFLLRGALVHSGRSLVLASFFAACFIGVFGYYRARTFHYPRVIFTVTGIIPLVPGISVYRALLQFSQGAVGAGLENAIQGFFVIAALAAGLTAGRAMTLGKLA